MCPSVSPSSWQRDFIYPRRVKIERFAFPSAALLTGHGAHRRAHADTRWRLLRQPGSRDRRERCGQSIWLTNLPVARRGERSPADSPPPSSLPRPVTEALQSSGSKGPKLYPTREGRVLFLPYPSGKCEGTSSTQLIMCQ